MFVTAVQMFIFGFLSRGLINSEKKIISFPSILLQSIKKKKKEKKKKKKIFIAFGSIKVQAGKKSLSVAVINEFCIFDLMEIYVKNLEFQGQKVFFFLSLYSTHHGGKTFPRNHRSQPNSSLEKSRN